MLKTNFFKINKIKLKSFSIFILFVIILFFKDLLFSCIVNNKDFIRPSLYNLLYTITNNKVMLLFHNLPLILILSFGLLINKKPYIYYIVIDFLFSSLLLLDLWAIRSHGNFLTFNFITKDYKVIQNSISPTTFIKGSDIFFVLDFLIIIFIFIFIKYKNIKPNFTNCKLTMVIIVIVSSLSLLKIIDMDKNKKLSFQINGSYWEPYSIVYETSPLVFHIIDIKNKITTPKRQLSVNNDEIITNWLIKNKENIVDNQFKGIFLNKNLIIMQIEAFESFPIGQKIGNEEITPNINKLLGESFNFPNIYDQTNGGVSSDADLLINTSIFPIRHKSTFIDYGDTTYNSLPKLLENLDYETLMLHGEHGGNWHFKVSDSYIGFDKVLDLNSFEIPPNFTSYYGNTTDSLILNTFISKIKTMSQPFFGHVVTLDSHAHFQYIPAEEYKLNLPEDLAQSYLGSYLQCINYVDTQIGEFIKSLKENNLYDNSVLVITGDHGGYKKYCSDELASRLKQYPWIQDDIHPKVPFVIHSKGLKGQTFDVIGGQIDIMPTLAYLFGVDKDKFNTTAIGKILVNTNRNFALLNGGIIIGSGNEEVISHYKEAFNISDLIIKTNYFKNRKYVRDIN